MNQIYFGLGWSPIAYHISRYLRLPRATMPSLSPPPYYLLPTSSLPSSVSQGPRRPLALSSPQAPSYLGSWPPRKLLRSTEQEAARTSGSSSMVATTTRAHGLRSTAREAAAARAHTLYLPLPTTAATPLTACGSEAEPPSHQSPSPDLHGRRSQIHHHLFYSGNPSQPSSCLCRPTASSFFMRVGVGGASMVGSGRWLEALRSWRREDGWRPW
jgi:hypothetical protein